MVTFLFLCIARSFVHCFKKEIFFVDSEATEVPIPGAKGDILTLVVQYMEHHRGVEPPIIEKPLRSKLMKDVCKDKFDSDYIDTIGENRQQLYDLILAFNYIVEIS